MSRSDVWNAFERKTPRLVDPGRGQRWITVYNTEDEDIPPWSAMEPIGVDRDGNVHVCKPTENDSNKVLLNDGNTIPAQSYGVGTNHMATWAYYYAADGDPDTGESIGTRTGHWQLYRGFEGFLVWGGAENDRVLVQRDVTCRNAVSGAYYYNGQTCHCCACDRFNGALSGFPRSLIVTLTVPCIGTRTATLARNGGPGCTNSSTNDHQSVVLYSFIDNTLGASTTLVDYWCDPLKLPAFDSGDGELLSIAIGCNQCYFAGSPVDGDWCIKGTGQWTYGFEWRKWDGVKANYVYGGGPLTLLSCNPFSVTATSTISCDDSIPSDCMFRSLLVSVRGDCANTPCAVTPHTQCVGGTVQLDGDE